MNLFKILNILTKLKPIKPFTLGRSKVIVLPKRKYKHWLEAVEYRAEWLTKEELEKLLNTEIIENKKVFVLIPIYEDEILVE